MSEVGAEHTHVVAAAISHAEHSFRRDLVGYTNAGREGRPVVIDVPAQVIRTEATHANDAFLDIGKSTFALPVHRLGEVDLPTQAVVEGQLRSNSPGVLAVEERALLPLCRV